MAGQSLPAKAEEEAIEKKAKEKAIEKKAKEKAIEKKAKEKAIERKAKRKAKKRTASTHEPSDRPRKVHKKTPSPHVEEGAEIVKPSFHKTLTTKRMASHSGLIKQGTTIYASNMEEQ